MCSPPLADTPWMLRSSTRAASMSSSAPRASNPAMNSQSVLPILLPSSLVYTHREPLLLQFFYPSTEWEMAQAFQCLCNTSSCRGTISGAKHMSPSQLEGYWLNAHIRHLLEEHHQQQKTAASAPENGPSVADPTAQALRSVLGRAELAVDAARSALRTYLDGVHGPASLPVATNGATKMGNGVGRRGPTSRELSGEMGGDTITA